MDQLFIGELVEFPIILGTFCYIAMPLYRDGRSVKAFVKLKHSQLALPEALCALNAPNIAKLITDTTNLSTKHLSGNFQSGGSCFSSASHHDHLSTRGHLTGKAD